MRGFTRITDTTPEAVIPLFNDYSDAIVSAIHEHGGDVLKLIGDGTLAIFAAQDRAHACEAALSAAIAARRKVAEMKERRAAEGKPVTDMYLGLHVGKVFYGNVGSRERLDFTVIGPAVNEASRIAAMCRSVDQPVLDVGGVRRSRQYEAPPPVGRPLRAARRIAPAGAVHDRPGGVIYWAVGGNGSATTGGARCSTRRAPSSAASAIAAWPSAVGWMAPP